MAPKQASEWQKRQKRKRLDELVKSQKGAMQKFLTPNPPIVDVEKEQNVDVEVEREHEEVEQEQERVEVEDEQDEEHVEKRFSATIYTRTLSNLKKCDREWLVYSKELDKMFCFCCKVLRNGAPKGRLGGVGFDYWHHATGRVREHEVSLDHLINTKKWFDLRKRLKSDDTIDKFQYEQFKKEAEYWKQVLFRIIALIKFLAKHNLAFRGNKEKLYEKGNGNFLGLVEMLEEFDPVIKEHVRRITSDNIHVHYLGHKIQNEIIVMLADEIKKELIKNIKEAKYYSIILDCTPDSSHKEQMTIIARYVKFSSNSIIVKESFLGFLNANDTTGKGLFDVTYAELQNLGLEIDNMRGQGYDNGANMKGSHQGVQKRFLKENPRAFYTPCGSHSLNLTLCDMAYSCVKGKSFFGHVQRIYTIFANSINRWQILKDNVKNWSLKSLSQTRWESRFESVKAIKLQLDDVRETLLEVGETDSDAAIAEEALALA
ncbi:zinc finger MYM-type protein 1-like [Helianthus annuus]|uniref:zinc finger MYM-type protein 1-like n=1 Tax=Helianthus annuus TaxID=4232 RepID=UPI000B905BCD|nr:zinc finger MYM-type protein 1-like [Helianthus annuus]